MPSACEPTCAPACYVPSSMEPTDAELVRVISVGTDDAPAAEAELCRRFATRIRLYGLRHPRDEDRAADLVQAVLLAVLQAGRAGRITDPERVDRFILGTSRNIALRMRETERRTSGEEALAELAAPDPDRERIDVGALARCVGALDDR